MLIVCPSCASEYAIDAERIGPDGRHVRCAKCGTGWFTQAPDAAVESRESQNEAPVSPQVSRPVPVAKAERRNRTAPGGTRRFPSRPARSRPAASTGLAVFVLALTCVAVPGSIAMRRAVVSTVPQSARVFEAIGLPVNLAGVTLDEVTSAFADEGGTRVLFTDGRIGNAGPRPARVPRIEIAIEGGGGDVLYHWSIDAPVNELAPGETARFKARLASPPPAGKRALVTFLPDREGPAVALR